MNHPNVYYLNSTQAMYITPKNCEGYWRVVKSIRRGSPAPSSDNHP